MPTLPTILDNTRFLVTEVQEQVKLTCGLLNEINHDLMEKIAAKDDYIDNLKTTVENLCFSRIHSDKYADEEETTAVRSLHVICVNLERIADFCVNIGRQTDYMSDPAFIHDYDYQTMFTIIQEGLSGIIPVFDNRNLSGALHICKTENRLDGLYKESFDRIMGEMHRKAHIPDLITVLFIFRYLERVGDSLLNIGEALIFSIIGDRIKIRHFEALQQTLTDSGFEGSLTDIDFNSIWGSRSGCRIGKVDRKLSAQPGEGTSQGKAQGLFKEGARRKIQKERESIRQWEAVYPGIAPRVFGFYEKDETASMLVEFLSGCTLEQVILTEEEELLANVIFVFEQTLEEIWEGTLTGGPIPTDYMKQLTARLDAIHRVHPAFRRPERRIDDLHIPSSDDLIDRCTRIEAALKAPFSIFIHGDFNVNNIIYSHDDQRINYIDLYRSKMADYIQDASVFLISNFRLPAFETPLRDRINRVIDHFFTFFSAFARRHDDGGFEVRMTLALARSFYTSSRFELNYAFAREMYLRSQFLMEKLVAHQGDWTTYRLPRRILFY